MKVFLVPSDPRWCIYLNEENLPTGDLGHICKGFKDSFSVNQFFATDVATPRMYYRKQCEVCEEHIPEDLEPTLRFITL